jgi:hypothetical protein
MCGHSLAELPRRIQFPGKETVSEPCFVGTLGELSSRLSRVA